MEQDRGYMNAVAEFSAASTRAVRLQQIGLIIPTYKAAGYWHKLREALDSQGLSPDQILIIDSHSPDETRSLAKAAGYRCVDIPQAEFNHGATRRLACDYFPDAEILLFMTQDALPATSQTVETLLRAFDDPAVGAAYGRQIPRPDADPIERHARFFNYPDKTQVRSLESREQLGVKTFFMSNSFAAYRRSALEQVGGFPRDIISGEDCYVAARLLMAGHRIIYQADAVVIHSHDLHLRGEFSRYFDTGVQHARHSWMLDTFGRPRGEGMRFVNSELRYLSSEGPLWIPFAWLRTVNKYVGYWLGSRERSLPVWLKRRLSAYPNFWDAEPSRAGVKQVRLPRS